ALSVSPRSWTDRIVGRGLATGIEAFDGRLHTSARFAEQAAAVVDGELAASVAAFEEVQVHDDGATFATRRALLEPAALAAFVDDVLRAARALDAGCARVPMPPLLAGGEDGWRALAARLGGRFEPGRGAVLDGALGLEQVEVVTWWGDDGELG